MSIFKFRVFKEYFLQTFRAWAEYPLNFGISLFWPLFSLIVSYFFWSIVFNTGQVLNYNVEKMVLYYLFSLGLFYDFNFVSYLRRKIIDGSITNILVRKTSLAEYLIYCCLSSFAIWMLVPIFIVLIVGLYYLGISAIFGLFIFFFGLILGCLVYSILISTSFWIGDNFSIIHILDEFVGLTSGSFLPLDLFPSIFYTISVNYLPFNLMFFTPAKVFLGDMAITWILIAKYILWIVALYLVLRFMIKRGLRRYEQLGG
ncbi:MAG: ABC-2 family transporter protein [Candidatus ainarchaeum sp.]|nr:ABC-2 family transporter protein [Candidatus ainarchaeum sp.]